MEKSATPDQDFLKQDCYLLMKEMDNKAKAHAAYAGCHQGYVQLQ